jgi:hypothetical protein
MKKNIQNRLYKKNINFICILIVFGFFFSACSSGSSSSSAGFKDLSYNNAIKQSGYSYLLGVTSTFQDPNFQKEYESNNKVFKEFFKAIPGNISAYPTFDNGTFFSYSWPKYDVYKYVLAVETQNLLIHLYDAQLDDKGIHGYAQILVNIDEKSFKKRKQKKPYLILSFTDFYILNDGSLESGWSDDTEVNLYNATNQSLVKLNKVTLQKENDKYLIVALEPCFNNFNLGKAVISTDAKVISYTQEQEIETSEKHCTLKFDYSNWDGKNIYMEFSSVYIPAFKTTFDRENFDISLNKSDILIKPKNKKDKVNMFDYPFTIDYLTIDQSNLNKVAIKNAVIYYADLSLQLGDLDIQLQTGNRWNTKKEVASMENPVIIDNCKINIKILDDNDILYKYEFLGSEGLILSFESSFPNQQSNRLKYEVIVGKKDLYGTERYSGKSFTFDKTVLEGTLRSIDTNGEVRLNYANLIFPKNSILDGHNLSEYYNIQKDGTIAFNDDAYIYNPSLFDLAYLPINSEYFTKDGLVLSVGISWYPNMELYGLLPNAPVEKMYVGFDGLIKEFKLKEYEEYHGTTLASGWNISNKKYSFQINQTKDNDGNLSPMEILLCFDDCKLWPPKGKMQDIIPVQNLKYRLKGSSMGFVFDDVILPEGVEIDFAKVFAKKQYNPEDTVRLSAMEVAEVNNILDQECVNLQREKAFRLYEEYEYDQDGNIIHEAKTNYNGTLIDYYYEYDENGNKIVSRYKNDYDEPQEMRYEYDDKGRITKRINVITGYEGRTEYEDFEDGYTERFYRKEAGQDEEKLSSSTTFYLNKDGKITSNSAKEKWVYDDRGNLIEYGATYDRKYEAKEKWTYNQQNELIQHDYNLRSHPETEKYEYFDGLLWNKLYKRGNDGTIYLYSYDNNNRLIKITSKYIEIDKWNNISERGTSTPQYFKYNEYGELVAEKNYSNTKMYSYEHYPDGKQKSKRVYIYNNPNYDM